MNTSNIPTLPVRLTPLSEEEIRSAWGVTIGLPLVSICCATYNHVLWIEDALCGFLAQRTDFPFEIIIRDDASTDGTVQILESYASNYPNIIRLVLNEVNQYALGYEQINAWPSLARGTYVALCEGDDFWISAEKLRKQVELMFIHPHSVMSVGLSHYFIQNKDHTEHYKTTEAPLIREIQAGQNSFYMNFHTSTFLFKRDVYESIVKKYWKRGVLDDTSLRSFLILYGTFVVLPEIVSVYRITGKGMFSSQNFISQLEWSHKIFMYLHEQLPNGHSRAQVPRLQRVALRLVKVHLGQKSVISALYWYFKFVFYSWLRLLNFSVKALPKRLMY